MPLMASPIQSNSDNCMESGALGRIRRYVRRHWTREGRTIKLFEAGQVRGQDDPARIGLRVQRASVYTQSVIL